MVSNNHLGCVVVSAVILVGRNEYCVTIREYLRSLTIELKMEFFAAQQVPDMIPWAFHNPDSHASSQQHEAQMTTS